MVYYNRDSLIAYFQSFSGISGDMILASCISAGLNPIKLESYLKDTLKEKSWKLVAVLTERCHLPAHMVRIEGKRYFKSPEHMKDVIVRSRLPEHIKTTSLKILKLLVECEAKAHGIKKEDVHFHEINSIDTLIDITGVPVALDMLNISKVYSSSINLGKAAPATLKILAHKKIPVYSDNHNYELTTPTGAAIISTIASDFGEMTLMKIISSGTGAGEKNISDFPNILNLIIGIDITSRDHRQILEVLYILETNIDDMDPRIYPFVMEKLIKNGAKDVWLDQIIMKKGRPGIKLSILYSKDYERKLLDILFQETTTLGIRRYKVDRFSLIRKQFDNKKIAYFEDGNKKISVEYEKAKDIAIKNNKPLRSILNPIK